MNKTIMAVFLGMFLLALGSAMYAGDTYEHNFNYPIINCSILNNINNLDGLNLSWNNSIAKIDTQLGYAPDSFTLNCWINESVEVKVSSSGGGHSHKVSITTNVTPDEVITIIEENPIEEKENETCEGTICNVPIEEKPVVPEKDNNLLLIIILGLIIGILLIWILVSLFNFNKAHKGGQKNE